MFFAPRNNRLAALFGRHDNAFGMGAYRLLSKLAATLLLFAAISPQAGLAQEISNGECSSGASISGQFDAGWFHNAPLQTRRQDGVWPGAPSGGLSMWDNPRDASPLGANTAVVANYAVDEVVGSGLTSNAEGGQTRFHYTGVGGTGTTFASAVTDNDYLQYQFTTPSTLATGTFFKQTGFGAWYGESYSYAIRISTSPTFATYWTVAQDQVITGASGGYLFTAKANTRFPVLQPSTTYYVRAYLYNRTVNLANVTGGVVANAVSADDFQLGTGVCKPTITITKVSTGGTGTFNFSGGNGFTATAVTTVTPDIGVSGPMRVLTASNTATTITEAAPTGGLFSLTGISCSGLGSGGTATNTINGTSGGSVLLDAAAVSPTAAIACTFTNAAVANLALTKTNTPGVNAEVDQAADTVNSGSTTTYTLTVTNNGPSSATGAVVTDTPGAGITCPAGNPVTITGSGVPSGSFTIANLTGAGITLGTLANGQSAVLTFSCNVN